MVDDKKVWAGQCHCGAVRFEATLSDGFNSILRCTCSYCRMRGAVVAMNSGWAARAGSIDAYRNVGADGLQHFPGFRQDAVEWLIAERDIAAAGDGDVQLSAEYQALNQQVAKVGMAVGLFVVLTIYVMTAKPFL
mgnify:CR=1 FL=1